MLLLRSPQSPRPSEKIVAEKERVGTTKTRSKMFQPSINDQLEASLCLALSRVKLKLTQNLAQTTPMVHLKLKPEVAVVETEIWRMALVD